MRKFLSFLFILPLFSLILACQENADVLGFTGGQDPAHAYDETFLTYYVLDGSELGYSLTESQQTALLYTWDQNDLLITEDRSTKQFNMKGYGTGFGFYILEDGFFETDVGSYNIVNSESLSSFVHYRIYAGYAGDDREELEEQAVENITQFLGPKTSNAGRTNVFISQLFIFGRNVLLAKNPGVERYEIISPLLNVGYTPQNGGKTVIINQYNQSDIIPMYRFIMETAEVLPAQFTQLKAKFTAVIENTVYNY